MNPLPRAEWDEGQKVELNAPAAIRSPTKWTGPEYPESIKRKYFGPRPHQAFPTWIYHPTEKARLVSESEAAEYGVTFRQATEDERIRLHMKPEFYDCTGEWRTESYPKDRAFDPNNLPPGKNYIPAAVNEIRELTKEIRHDRQTQSDHARIQELETLVKQLLANTQPRDIQSAVEPEVTAEAHKNALADVWKNNPEAELEGLRNYARELGIDVDGRWSGKRLRQEIEKAGS